MKYFNRALAGNYQLGENKKLVHFIYTLQTHDNLSQHKLMLLSEQAFKKENFLDVYSAARFVTADDGKPSLFEIAVNPEYEGKGYASGVLRLGLNMVREPRTKKLDTVISCEPKGQKRRLDFYRAMGFEDVPEYLNDYSVVRWADANHPRLKIFKNQTVLAEETAQWDSIVRSGKADYVLEKSVFDFL